LISSSPESRSFVLHVDMPVFHEAIYESLWNTPGDAVVPVFDGRRGHPVLLSASALNEIKRLDPATGRLDSWLRHFKAVEVPVGNGEIHRNMNQVIA
jgi:CTP:molybdopterin cytidylyltransferase MocA